MRNLFRTFFAPPAYPLENEKKELARLITTTANLILAASIFYSVILPFLEKTNLLRLYMLLPLFPLIVIVKWLVTQNKLDTASYLLVWSLWAVLATDVIFSGGVFSSFYAGMLVIIFFAKLLLGKYVAYIVMGTSILLGLVMIIAGALNPTIGFRYESAATIWITQSLYMIVSLLILNLTTDSIRNALKQARDEIFQREITEEILRQSENKFNTVFYSSPVAMVISSLDQGVLDVNDAFLKLTGYERKEILGRSSLDFNFWVEPKEQARTAEILLRDGAIQDFEFHFRTKSGKVGIGLASAVMIDVLDEQVSLATIVDISDRKSNEEKNRQLNIQLEARVQERTRELEQINHELEAFSYSVSHDLRTPLRALDGFSKILLDNYSDQLDEQGRHYQKRVRENAIRMTELTNDLLELSRTSRSPLRKILLSPTNLAQAVWQDMSATKTDALINFTVSDDIPDCEADEGLLRLVFANLLGNAIKYSKGRNPIQIEVGSFEQESIPVLFVKDNGIGFDQNMQMKSSAFSNAYTAMMNTKGPGLVWLPSAGLSAAMEATFGRHHSQTKAQPSISPCKGVTISRTPAISLTRPDRLGILPPDMKAVTLLILTYLDNKKAL